MFKKGEAYRKENLTDELCLKLEDLKLTEKSSKMSINDQEIANKGDIGQGERLVKSKKK